MRVPTWLFRTKASVKGHFIVGTFLMFLTVPAGAIDIMMAPEAYRINPNCDAILIAIFGAVMFSPVWLAISALLVALLCHFCVKGRQGGKHILDWPFKPTISGVFWNVIILLAVFSLLFDFANHVLNAGSEFTITSDCGGKAEPRTATIEWPLLQWLPVLFVFQAVWFLHLRSLVSTPYEPAAQP